MCIFTIHTSRVAVGQLTLDQSKDIIFDSYGAALVADWSVNSHRISSTAWDSSAQVPKQGRVLTKPS